MESILDIVLSLPLPVGMDSTSYSIAIAPGEYLVGAFILEQDMDFGMDSIFFHKKNPNDFFPAVVTVKNDTTKVENIDIDITFSGL